MVYPYIVCVLSMTVLVTWAFPIGPPIDQYPAVCETMHPMHNASAQTSTPPFEIVYTSNNNEFTITIRNTTNTYYEGVFLQARRVNGSNEPVGVFDVSGIQSLKTLNCGSGTKNAVSQSNKAHYTEHQFKWRNDKNVTEAFRFQATFVHETDEFWVGVISEAIENDAHLLCVTDIIENSALQHVMNFLSLAMCFIAINLSN